MEMDLLFKRDENKTFAKAEFETETVSTTATLNNDPHFKLPQTKSWSW